MLSDLDLKDRRNHLVAKLAIKEKELISDHIPFEVKQTIQLQKVAVKEAIDCIDNNPKRYGLCKKCGKNIGLRRLKKLPETKLCVACKSEEERNEY